MLQDSKYSLYERGLNSSYPNHWARVENSSGLYGEEHVKCHKKLNWLFFSEKEAALRHLEIMNSRYS